MPHVLSVCPMDVTQAPGPSASEPIREYFSSSHRRRRHSVAEGLIHDTKLVRLVRVMFDKMDYDSKGTLDAKKVAAVARAANCELTQENAKAAMEGLRCTMTEPVAFEKFLAWYATDPAGDGVWLTAVRTIMTTAMQRRRSLPGIPLEEQPLNSPLKLSHILLQ